LITAIDESELSRRFAAVHVCAVSDCLDHIGLRFQALRIDLATLDPRHKFAGPAYTVRGRPSGETDPAKRMGPSVIDGFPRGCVVCYDAGGDMTTGVWGELWTAGAVARGTVGAIVDGAIRDAERIMDYDYPLFFRGRRPTDSSGRFTVVDHDVPVEIGGVTVRPGDFVLADLDGAVVVPAEHAVEVLERAEKRKTTERSMRTELDTGARPSEVYRRHEHF
jgi:4-hydroxy-4-methyl-2-oxoglutarate aldolase